MTCKWFTDVLAVLLLVCATTAARGDDAFKRHYEAGLSSYSSEDYDSAIKEFQAAYAIKPRPRLLFNIGQAYRNIGNAKQALHYYLLYQALESDPKPGLKAELEGYIAQMNSILAQAEKARRAEDRDLTAASASSSATSAPPLATAPWTTEPAASPPPSTPPPAVATAVTWTPPPAEPRRPVYKRGWFWGVIGGTAAVVLVTGLAVGLSANANSYGGDIRHPTF